MEYFPYQCKRSEAFFLAFKLIFVDKYFVFMPGIKNTTPRSLSDYSNFFSDQGIFKN